MREVTRDSGVRKFVCLFLDRCFAGQRVHIYIIEVGKDFKGFQIRLALAGFIHTDRTAGYFQGVCKLLLGQSFSFSQISEHITELCQMDRLLMLVS